MRNTQLMAPLLLVLSLFGCAKPVPPEKASYVGEWQDKTMYLLITQDGSVKYKRVKGNETTTMDVPIKGFVGDDIQVGLGPMTTTFVVSKPPYQDGAAWKMTVDGAELTKSSE